MVNVNDIHYASDGETWYSVFPIYKGEALATLTEESDSDNPEDSEFEGGSFRIMVSELLEDYRIYDANRNEITEYE